MGAATHPGNVRPGNEDAYFASREEAVFAVADGMGGHEFGEVASHLAIEIVEARAALIAQAPPTELPLTLHETIQAANAEILSHADAQEARNRMGTTIVLATICGDRLYFAHLGDSRLYLLRGDVFSQLTRDHSLVQVMVERGEITPEEAAIHPLRHQITRVVGGEDHVSPEIASQALEPGDTIVLCTDGLTGAVSLDAIRAILANDNTAQEKADALVQAALDAGGPDNVTAVVFTYQRPRPLTASESSGKAKAPHISPLETIKILLLCIAIAVVCTAIWAYTHPQYYITADSQGIVAMYKRWPMLPMLNPMRAENPTDPDYVPVTLEEARSQLVQSGDIQQGIEISGGKDAGVVFLTDLTKATASTLLEEAKTAVDHGDLPRARTILQRVKVLHGDTAMIGQLDRAIAQAEKKPASQPPAPKKTLAPQK
ncbi:MAG TPA: Stp1/IreP family PP2C-type Ser/Thr phosphatase [Armatimonadota bacterium]